MKKMLIYIAELFVIFIAALYGFLMNPFHAKRVLSTTQYAVRSMVWDWVIASVIAWVLLLAVEFAVRKRREAWARPTICLAIVLILGAVAKLGLKTTDIGPIF